MIATGILVACLFAVLALTSNSLVTARKLQQHRTVDSGMISSMVYVKLFNTNRVDPGEFSMDLDGVLPGYKFDGYVTPYNETNKLAEIDYLVERDGKLELTNIMYMYLPTLNTSGSGISSELPQH